MLERAPDWGGEDTAPARPEEGARFEITFSRSRFGQADRHVYCGDEAAWEICLDRCGAVAGDDEPSSWAAVDSEEIGHLTLHSYDEVFGLYVFTYVYEDLFHFSGHGSGDGGEHLHGFEGE